jgi:hypothetical protein
VLIGITEDEELAVLVIHDYTFVLETHSFSLGYKEPFTLFDA